MNAQLSRFLWFLATTLCVFRGLADAPAPGFFIEAEDFDHDGGLTVPAASVMPYLGGAYAGLSALAGVDYARAYDVADGDTYRSGEAPNQPVVVGGEPTHRGTWEVPTVYRLGWMDGGHWYNYTRTVPAGRYRVFAAMSGAYRVPGYLNSALGVVVDGYGTATQTVSPLGTFNADASGGWGVNRVVPLTSSGTPVVVEFGGDVTLRYTSYSGDADYLQLVAEAAPVIAVHPSDQEGMVGGKVTLTVDAGGGADLTYQWRRNGMAIPGATSATLELDPFSGADVAGYDVLVSNGAGSTPSDLARVTAAYGIALGDTVSEGVPVFGAGHLVEEGMDGYLLTIAEPTTVFVDELGSDTCSLSLRLVDPDGVQLASKGFGPCSGPSLGVVHLAKVGTYRFEVSAAATAGSYSFRVTSVLPGGVFPIAVGDSVSSGQITGAPVAGAGVLEAPGSVDEYTFSGELGQWVYLEERATENCGIRWQLLRADDSVVFDQWLSDSCGWDAAGYLFQLDQTGEYRLRVFGNGSTSGTYSFRLWDATPQDFVLGTAAGSEVGPGTINGASVVGAGSIETPGGADNYGFEAVAGEWLYFDENNGDSSCVVRLEWELYGPDGTRLWSDPLDMGCWWGNSDLGRFQVPATGTYRLRVLGNQSSTGTYSFRIQRSGGQSEFPIALGQVVTVNLIGGAPSDGAGILEYPGSEDAYLLEVTSPVSVYFEDNGSAVCCLYWSLYAPDGGNLMNDGFDGNDVGRIDLTQTGTYRIVVRPSGSLDSWMGAYSFTLRPIPANDVFAIGIGDLVSDGAINGVSRAGAGRLEEPGAQDVYEFEISAPTSIYLDDRGVDACCLNWALIQPDGNWMSNHGFGGGDPGRRELTQVGTYRILVYPAGALTEWVGAYSFQILSVPPDEVFDLLVGQSVSDGMIGGVAVAGAGRLESPGAVDYYRLNLPEGGRLYFDDQGSDQCCLAWWVRDPEGGYHFFDGFDGGDPGRRDFILGGEYLVAVYPNGASTDYVGAYRFQILDVPPDGDFVLEPGQTVSDGQIGGMAVAGAGRLESAGSVDYYRVNLPVGGAFYFDDLGSEQCCLGWWLRDPAGTYHFFDDMDGSDPGRRDFTVPGEYLIAVYPNGASLDYVGAYSFRMLVVPADGDFPIEVGQTVTDGAIDGMPVVGAGRLEGAGSVDYYRFTLDGAQAVYFDDLGSEQCCLGWWLRDPSGSYHFFDGLDGSDPGRRDFTLPGEYLIAVYPNGALVDYVGSYSFRLWPVEPDQVFNVALNQEVMPGMIGGVAVAGAGELSGPGAMDYYEFTLTEPTYVYFEDEGSDACCLAWWVWDAASGYRFFDGFDGNDPGMHFLGQAGTYRIGVYPNGASPEFIGGYRFRLWNANTQGFAMGDAREVGAGQLGGVPTDGAGVINVPGQADEYTFVGVAGEQLYFQEIAGNGCLFYWQLLDPNGNSVFFMNLGRDGCDDGNPGWRTLGLSGTYRLMVGGHGASTGNYGFRILRKVVPYSSGDWVYRQVGADEAPGFESGPVPLGFEPGAMPFGNQSCPGPASVYWDPGTEIAARRTVDLPDGATGVQVAVAVDNDVRVWWNGIELTTDWGMSEGCAVADRFVFEVPEERVVRGVNELAVRGRDRGGATYLDVEVRAVGLSGQARLTLGVVGTQEEGTVQTATVTRDGGTADAVEVVLSSGDPARLGVPASVVIPAGEISVSFAVTALDDEVVGLEPTIELVASAPGLLAASAGVKVVEDDIPTLTMEMPAGGIHEDAAGGTVRLTLRRGAPTGPALQVRITGSAAGVWTGPGVIEIPSGVESVPVDLTLVNDAVADGDHAGSIGGQLLVAGQVLRELDFGALVVEDDDVPSLVVTVSPSGANEGVTGAAILRVTRNTPPTGILEVGLEATGGDEVSLPGTLEIPAGEWWAEVVLDTLLDGIADGDQVVSLRATAPDHADGATPFTVADVDLPNLVVESVTVPPVAYLGLPATVRWTIRNAGTAPVVNGWTDRLLVSMDSTIGGDIALVDVVTTATLPLAPGATVELERTGVLPVGVLPPGEYRVVVFTDIGGGIRESSESDNAGISAGGDLRAQLPLTVAPAGYDTSEGTTLEFTVDRGAILPFATVVTVTSPDPANVQVPSSVIIPAGASSIPFQAVVVDDDFIEPDMVVTLTISATGFLTRSVDVLVRASDQPTVTLSASPLAFSEGAGPGAGVLTVTRSPVSSLPLQVGLSVTDDLELSVSTFVVIPAGEASVTTGLNPLDDAVVDGDKDVTVNSVITATGTAGGSVAVTVRDDDVPTLTLSVVDAVVGEGRNPATTATVRRNTATTLPLVVSLLSADTTEAVVPATVEIPAGEAAASFAVLTVDDGVTDDAQTVVLRASAAGHAAGETTLTVTDVDLPDLAVVSVNGPSSVESETQVNVTYRVENRGRTTATGPIVTRLLLSADAVAGDDTLLNQYSFAGDLPPGGYFEFSPAFFAPRRPGVYRWVVVTDAAQTVRELTEANNTLVGADPVEVVPEYTVAVETPVTVAPAGTVIPFNGTATLRNGQPAGSKLVSAHVLVRGTRRIIGALTGSDGSFSGVFRPLPGEAGSYELAGAHPGVETPPTQDAFVLLGFRVLTPAEVRLSEASSAMGATTVENLSGEPLTGLAVELVSAPSGLAVDPELGATVLPGDGSVSLGYTVSAGPGTAGSGPVRLRVTCAQGPSVEFDVPVRVDALRPVLVAQPASLVAGVLRGQQRVIEVDLVNQGGLPTGPVAVELPPLTWLSLVTEQPLPSIAVGETRRIALRLAPDADEALTQHDGSVFLRMAAAGLNVPFQFRILSDGVGTLRVTAVDEFTFYAPGAPKVAGAQVTVRDAVSRAEVRTGTTDVDGVALFAGLAESFYEVEVKSDRHSTYRGTASVVAGQTEEIEALILRQTVRYVWTVEQIQVEDRTQITVEAVFETAVPAPVVTVEPAILDADGLDVVGQEKQVDVRISNHGLIAATDVYFSPGSHPWYEVIPLIRDIGPLPANSSLVIPVRIVRTGGPTGVGGGRSAAPAAGVPCELSLGLAWFYPCGQVVAGQGIAIPVLNVRGDCGPLVLPPGTGWVGDFRPCENCGGPWYITGPTVQVKGDCDQCMAKAIIECAIGFTPAGCAYGVFQCLASPADPGGSSFIGTAETCLIARLGCIPNPWVNAGLCAYAIGKCRLAAGSGAGSGRRAAPLGDGVLSTDPLTAASLDGLKVIDWFVLLWGGTADEWFGEGGGDTIGGWHAAFAGAVDPASDGGGLITDTERAALLLAPRPPTVPESRALSAIERWNRSLDYWRREWLEVADVPAGESTDFIAVSVLRAQSAKVVEAFDTARSKGSENPFIEVSRQLDLRDQKLASGDGSVCARVRLRLDQTAIQTRDAFKATLELNNGSEGTLTDIQVEVFVKDADGNDASDRFGFRAPTISGLSAVDGTGTLSPQSDGSVSWVLIPTVDAAPMVTTPFYISGRLRYTQEGATLDIPLAPQRIDVHPSPQLAISYFHQRDVFSDDPFTPAIEPRIPYSLGVMVRNFGHGTARDFRIVSAEPRIVENEKGLLIDFQLIATEVAGVGLFPTLTAEFGEIPPGDVQIGRWLFTSSLQGSFTDYTATFEHLDAIAGKKTSLIDSVDIHEMTRMVEAQGGFSDGKPDFLVNDDADDRYLPDHLYLSDASVHPVSAVEDAMADGVPGPGVAEVRIRATVPTGWVYLRLPEPSAGGLPLRRVFRSDGSELPVDKLFWVTDRTFGPGGTRPVYETVLHLLDYNSTGEYRLQYGDAPPLDETAPVSSVAALPAVSPEAAIPVSWSGTDDVTGVALYDVLVSVNGAPAEAWLVGTTATSGVYVGVPGGVYAFYSIAVDGAGNREAAPVVPDASTRVNRAPVAGNDPVTGRAGQRLRIPVAQVLANDTDPDLDSLTVVSVDAASAAGGTASLSGGWVSYTPPPDPVPGDTIGYTVGDPFGGTARGSILVSLEETGGSPLTLVTITADTAGVVLEFVGIPGRTYRIERSATLSPPWTALGTAVADRYGRFRFTDVEAPAGEAFYRTVEVSRP